MPSPVDLKDFLAGFLLEADEHLHAVNRNLLAVASALRESRPEPRAVRELLRSLHTIKGLAAMVGVEPVVDLAHEMEGVLRGADRAGGRLSEQTLDLLVQGTRAIEERVHAVSKGGVGAVPAAPAPLLEALAATPGADGGSASRSQPELVLPPEAVRSLSTSDREQIVQACQSGRRVVLVEFQPSADRAARELNITAVRSHLSQLGELVKVLPRAVPAAPTGIAFDLLLVTAADDAAISAAVGGAADAVQQVTLERAGLAGRVGAAGGAGVRASEGSAPASGAAMPRVGLDERFSGMPYDEPEGAPLDHSIRVDVRRLDDALEQLSALVVTRFRMARVAADLAARGADARELNAIIAESSRQLRRLRAAITQARMVRLAELLQRLPLVVRGLTRDTGKTVEIAIQAGSAEVDKAVADRIFPAVVHLVRNAVDHAIEPREERRAAGKPEAGQLSIVCDDSSGTTLMLQVADDGRGIDRESVARRLGRAPARTDDELLRQIATPGLTTREAITRASGRGMGMDIVRRTVEALGGSLEMQTVAGSGTRFTIRVPVSITIVDVFSFACGREIFVAPIAMIEEIVEIDPSRLIESPVARREGPLPRLVQRRGEAIPFLTLESVLRRRQDAAVPPKALVVRQPRGAIAFGVDRMLGQQEVVVRPLDDALVRVPGVTGATDLGDGMLRLVLDLGALGATLAGSAGAAS